jgi:DNA-binding LacI/PurR family transcriptional regulator
LATRRVTSIDVAKLAGVSQSTVSRTFSGEPVSDEKRARVMKAAATLGYRPNAIARSLTTQNTNIIGVVMANITSPFYPYVLEKFTGRLQENGKQVLLFTTAPDQEVDDILPLVLQYRVDALIITSTTLSSGMADECSRDGTPVILFNRYVQGSSAYAVCCDNVEGGRRVADLLLDAGHTAPAYLAGVTATSTNQDRERGFFDRLRERGITNAARVQGAYTYESGFKAACELLSAPQRPDALFCANDIMAIGAIDCARDLSLSLPDDVSIIGFDDVPMAAWSAYRLTTIRQPVNQMIDATMDLLNALLQNDTTQPAVTLLPGSLIRRGSARLPEPADAALA